MAKKKKKAEKTGKPDTEQVKVEDSEDDGTLDDPKYLIEYIKNCKKEAERASKPRRDVQRELWLLYQNKEDWSKKKEWQSKIFIPKVFMAIERASALVKRAILQTSKLFTMELRDEVTAPLNTQIRELRSKLAEKPENESAVQGLIDTAQKKLDLLKEQLTEDERRFKKELKRSNYVSAYGEMTKPALLLGMGDLKRLFNADKKKLRYENIDILNLYISPDFMPFEDENPDYLIEYKEMSLAILRKMAKKTNENGVNVFDMDEIEKVKAESQKVLDKEQRRQRRGLGQYSNVSKKVGILEFWGNVESKDGKTIKENQLMMLVNEKHLIRKQDNPFADGKYPHDLTFPIVYPHRGSGGVSLVESGVRLQYTLNNILNMFVDNLNFIVNKVFTYQPTALIRPQDIMSIYPGKMIPVNVAGSPINEVKMTPLSSDAFKVFEIIGNEIQEANAVTEFLMGMPGKKSKTLGEVEIKTAESQGLFDVIARELELNSIKPTLKSSYDLLVQFSNFKGEYEFNVGGLSLLLLKKEQIQTLMQAMMLAMKSPELRPNTDIQELWKRLLDIWNLSDAYREPEDMPEQTALLPGQVPGQAAGASGAAPVAKQPTPEQRIAMDQKAAAEARQVVANMSPEEIMAS